MERMSQENIESSENKKNLFEIGESGIALEDEGLQQNIEEIKLEPGEYEDYRKKVLIEKAEQKRDELKNHMSSIDNLNERSKFGEYLKNKYGKEAEENALYHILIGSSVEDHFEAKDFEGGDSILDFLDSLAVKFNK